jgi:predicted dehydrogenase
MAVVATALSRPASLPRIGFVGLGWIGTHRLCAMAESGRATVAALADCDPTRTANAARAIAEWQPPGATCTFEELLQLDLDGVVIATPNHAHASQAQEALGRGFAVFCQKPLARARAEASAIVRAAREADRLLGVDFCYRNVAGMQEIKSRIASGAIGEVFAADLTFHNAYGPDKPWFFDAHLAGGGCVMDLGIHLVDLLLWVLNYPQVERVDSRLYRQGKRLEQGSPDLEDYATAEISFATGVSARLACSWHLSAGCDAVITAVFHGTRGALRLRNLNGSFYDFATEDLKGTRQTLLSKSSGEWGAVGICDWAARLACDPRFDPDAHRFEDVHTVLDGIYGR